MTIVGASLGSKCVTFLVQQVRQLANSVDLSFLSSLFYHRKGVDFRFSKERAGRARSSSLGTKTVPRRASLVRPARKTSSTRPSSARAAGPHSLRVLCFLILQCSYLLKIRQMISNPCFAVCRDTYR